MKRIAIVNRGEAAGRCLRAIKELRTEERTEMLGIALFTDPDRSAPFVRQADVTLSLGPAMRAVRGGKPRPVYLDRSRIAAALRATRADAVWPGWGFLAEDAEFVASLEARGLVFIGPGSDTILTLGDKIAAKRLATSVDVPVIPWSGGPVLPGDCAAAAQHIGYPLLIKAAAGGGGRGIRLVERPEDLVASFASARSEAEHAFGNDTLFFESVVERPRHVEVQFAADNSGDVAVLGLRDCSVQRRHQKVLEEAPPPFVSESLATAMCDAASRLATAAAYRGVGTAEFLIDTESERFHFLEVNPRLQVEHGLTETLTGIDLVKLQLRLARGDALPSAVPQSRGHAIEARVCAEDPANGFAPSPGEIVLLDVPTGPGVRVDCSASKGTTVPAEFDSLIAKVIAHAPTRREALSRLYCALADFRLILADGATNKGFLLQLLEHDDLQRGGVDIDWLDRNTGCLIDSPHAEQALIVAAVLTYLNERALQRLNFLIDAARGRPRSIPLSSGRTVDLAHAGQSYRLQVHALGNWNYRLELDDRVCVAHLLDQEENACQLVLDDERYAVEYAVNANGLQIEVNGYRHVVTSDTGGQVRASAPSVVVAIDVRPGDEVAAGQQLGMLETMKIEVAFHAPSAGTVKEVLVRHHERVAAGQLLLVVQPDNEPTAEREAPRLALPHSEDPLDELYDEENRPQNGALISDDRLQRDRARSATLAALRRILLGYDTAPDRDDTLHEIFERTLPPELSSEVLTELADFRRAVVMFADTEILFSRLPGEPDEGTPSRSNDAWLTLYLRRIEAAGAGIDESFRDQLCRALEHFGITGLSPSEALDRALLRLYATRTRRELRHRIAESILRLLGRLANAGVNLGEDEPLARALGICLELRGEVPDSLSDAAAEARYTIFELPQIERRTAAATAIVEEALQTIASGNASGVDLETLVRIADSAPALFDRIAAWATDASATRVQVALQALVLRQFAATVPRRCTPLPSIHETAVEVEFEDGITVLAAFAKLGSVDEVWEALCNSGRGPRAPLIEVTVLADGAIEEDALRAEVSPLVARAPAETRRVCFSTLPTSKNPLTLAYSGGAEGRCEQTDLMGLHPETARRLDLDRLVEFDVERLPAPRSIYAFHGKSSVVPDDERIFVFAEVRAALPGRMGTLHEAAFAQTFAEAARTLRRLRNEHEIWQRLHWNRLFLVVRPAFYLLPATLDRLARELLPATRHLGLQKIIVRLALRDQPQDTSGPERELVIEPSPDGPEHIDWRDPHRGPIPPADANARRLAEARRRGLIYPYDAIRLFTQGEHAAASFEEYDLDARTGGAVSVGDRAPGGNRAAVVFGVITTPTDKHPEGVKRVCILSDPTREMGALAAPECDRLIAALDLAEKLRVPAEWVANSAGARISMDSGTENLDAVAGVVRRIVHFTEQGGEINIIVSGVNVGAQSYFDALSTMLMHTRGILIMTNSGSMVLTGRNALEASGSISAEDELGIGGFERIMGPNGQAQYYGRDLAEAYEILMRHYTYTFVAPGESQPRPFATTDPAGRAISQAPYEPSEDDFASIGAILSDQTNPGRKRPFAIRPLMRALVDRDGGWLERWTNMAGAENAVVWDAHLGGHPICLIGIENRPLPRAGHPPLDGPDQWTGATLFPFSSKKVARAINAASANRSVVLLANLAGFDGSPESMRKLQLEYGAEIARAVVNFQGRFLFVVVSRYHGGAYVVFSRHLNEGIHAVALSGSYASVIGGGPAASVIFSAEVRRRTSADPRLAALEEQLQRAGETLRRDQLRIQLESLRTQVSTEKHAEVAAEFDRVHSVERARQVGSLHDIVSTDDLRRHLIEHL